MKILSHPILLIVKQRIAQPTNAHAFELHLLDRFEDGEEMVE